MVAKKKKVNPNLTFLREWVPKTRIVALQGGTRSAKTYSTLQYLIELCHQYKGMTISVARQELTVLKATVLRDFVDILKSEGIYSEANHNKSQNTYLLNGNLWDFFGLDEEEKVRGRKRDILFLNEGNQASYEAWKQLLFRTTTCAIIDYNPSMYDHWIYDEVLTRADCKMLISTYKDNPHLSPEQVTEIERYKETDNAYYQVFGLGQRGKLKTGAEFYHRFNRGTHAKSVPYNPALPVHLTFDFNVVPYITLLCAQVDFSDNKTRFRIYREYCLPSPNNSSRAVCEAFIRDHKQYNPLLFYYGDASGKNRIAGLGDRRVFDDVETTLLPYLHGASDRVLTRNPSQLKARDFMNLILAGHWPDISIEVDEGCKELIADLENVKLGIQGKVKERVNDKELGISYEKYGHPTDALTYLVVSVLYELYKAAFPNG